MKEQFNGWNIISNHESECRLIASQSGETVYLNKTREGTGFGIEYKIRGTEYHDFYVTAKGNDKFYDVINNRTMSLNEFKITIPYHYRGLFTRMYNLVLDIQENELADPEDFSELVKQPIPAEPDTFAEIRDKFSHYLLRNDNTCECDPTMYQQVTEDIINGTFDNPVSTNPILIDNCLQLANIIIEFVNKNVGSKIKTATNVLDYLMKYPTSIQLLTMVRAFANEGVHNAMLQSSSWVTFSRRNVKIISSK
jgi:hypothetical protein